MNTSRWKVARDVSGWWARESPCWVGYADCRCERFLTFGEAIEYATRQAHP